MTSAGVRANLRRGVLPLESDRLDKRPRPRKQRVTFSLPPHEIPQPIPTAANGLVRIKEHNISFCGASVDKCKSWMKGDGIGTLLLSLAWIGVGCERRADHA